CGILFQAYGDIFSFCIYFCLVGLTLILLSYHPKIALRYKWNFLFGTGFFLLLFTVGVFAQQQTEAKQEWDIPSDIHLYEGLLIDEPLPKPKTIQCKLKIINSEEEIIDQVFNKKAIIYLPQNEASHELNLGDKLLFYGKLEESPPFLKKQSFASSGFVNQEDWIKKDSESAFSISIKALQIRRFFLNKLQKIIPDKNNYSLAAALMFGYKYDLDKDLRQSFANIGAGHILAVSGLHFSIVFGMFYFFLSFLGNSFRGRIIKNTIILPLIWGFAFLTGLSPSVIRAASMISIWSIGNMFFYRGFTLNTIAVSAFFMLLLQPEYLFDVGFQLSFSAVISIVLFNSYIQKLYETKNRIINYAWNLTSVSFSAQIGVLPLSLYYFNQIPIVFLITNWLLIPLVTILLFLLIFCLLLSYLWSNVFFINVILNKILSFFLSIVSFLDHLPYRSIDNIQITILETGLSYIVIACIIFFFLKKRILYLYPVIIIVMFLLIYYLC
ncbi:MAG: ComEC/Rec2 family competence protein, partial [Dysgonamonadaceae bacterium]|nr:ComEC/Rec2 family competence protein [Dysgonamonadaceae bacterium]